MSKNERWQQLTSENGRCSQVLVAAWNRCNGEVEVEEEVEI